MGRERTPAQRNFSPSLLSGSGVAIFSTSQDVPDHTFLGAPGPYASGNAGLVSPHPIPHLCQEASSEELGWEVNNVVTMVGLEKRAASALSRQY